MKQPDIHAYKKKDPRIYAYTTPEIARHEGWLKIGYTEQDLFQRVQQQAHTVDVEVTVQWTAKARFRNGKPFRDKEFHAYLRGLGFENDPKNEWFHIDPDTALLYLQRFIDGNGRNDAPVCAQPYRLRAEQEQAVEMTCQYIKKGKGTEFLWNAKPRFGKTLAVYHLVFRMNWKRVLIVTNRPAIANSWYDDYVQFVGEESDFLFVSHVDALKGKPYVMTREEYMERNKEAALYGKCYNCIEFVSLQDLKGSTYFGGWHSKLEECAKIHWNLLVIDEAHEGVDTYKTDIALERIQRSFALHLSGTPFKALASEKFPADAIYNWTYADEQRAKRDWSGNPNENPYEPLPCLNLYTYQMSDMIREEVEHGAQIGEETVDFAFDLNEFFAVQNDKFVHEAEVDRFLDALSKQFKYPFSTEEMQRELSHTFWLLNRVDSVKALSRKLKTHPIFWEYHVIQAAGDGKPDDQEETRKSYDSVRLAIQNFDKTITLSVGQLTTGVTIPEWTAVLMLCNMSSPALYMQAAFRAQNPCMIRRSDGELYRKENAYVFDFDPARTLLIFEQFANDLSLDTADGKGDSNTRLENVRELLNFFPVLGEDEQGEMVPLDAEKVLSIPRKIKSKEVVRHGFMSDFLFQNIANVFHAPPFVLDMIQSFTAEKEPNRPIAITSDTAEELSIDERGEVTVSEPIIIGRTKEIFGDKVYAEIPDKVRAVTAAVPVAKAPSEDRSVVAALKQVVKQEAVQPMVEAIKQSYAGEVRMSDKKKLTRKLEAGAERIIEHSYGDFAIQRNVLEQERETKLEHCPDAQKPEVHQEYDRKQEETEEEFHADLSHALETFVRESEQELVRDLETHVREQEKRTYEDQVRDHLRGFSRTIPSFLMAYGDESTTLENFDQIVPDHVFLEVTSITLEDFRFLRDGGQRTDPETGEVWEFQGGLFDPVVFNDSIREFLRLKRELSDYFEESQEEDIFDYIPPQRTNQIFTPKQIVREMADLMEKEYPHCFDSPDMTFADLYMKSGLFLAEVVRRLYRSPVLKQQYPDKMERLNHIFSRQLYALAPTEIIYRIVRHYVLGFDTDGKIREDHIRQFNAGACSDSSALEAALAPFPEDGNR